ncbi:hypothetical protein Yalta_080 [Yalta virus]|nr:hypothetical protein Yalta_080 [Yalta virus]
MISSIINEYSFGNVLLLCFQIILPLLIYIISFTFVSDTQSKWFNDLSFNTGANIITGNKGIFIGCVVYILTGVASLLVMDFYHHKNTQGTERLGKKLWTKYFTSEKESTWHFYLFPIMLLLSNLGFIIAYQTKEFLPHIIMNSIGALINLYIMFHYARTISYNIALLLLPLLLWQLFNIIYYGIGVYSPDLINGNKNDKPPERREVTLGGDATVVIKPEASEGEKDASSSNNDSL